jgi:hypothetical protein
MTVVQSLRLRILAVNFVNKSMVVSINRIIIRAREGNDPLVNTFFTAFLITFR